jgi:predicted dehydrogenase
MALNNRVVVVGLGSIGRRHARLLSARGDLQVEWCENSAEMRASARQDLPAPARVHPSFAAALDSAPALMVIATPHAAHAEQAVAALQRGVHVLCEKPLSDSLARAREIVAAATAARSVFTIGFQLHFHPAMQRMRELIRGGELGSVHHVHALVGTYGTLVNSRSRYQASLEGALLLDYAHQPDLFHHLLGEWPVGVYAIGGQGGGLPLQSNPNFLAVACDYARPLITTLHLNYLQTPERHDYEVIGDRGWLSLDVGKGELRRGTHGETAPTTESFSTGRDTLYQQEHQAFLDAITGNRAAESPAAEGLASMQVIEAALQSLRERRRVAIDATDVPAPAAASGG